MKVFVAGATGVIGRPLVRQLVAAGHDVAGMTSREPGNAAIDRWRWRSAVVCDALDADAVKAAVGSARPDVVINQLTKLPRDYDPRNMTTSTPRPTGFAPRAAHNLHRRGDVAAGAQRFVTQSIAFLYAPEGEMVKDEDGRPSTDAPAPFGDGVRAMVSTRARGARGGRHPGPGAPLRAVLRPPHLLRRGREHRRTWSASGASRSSAAATGCSRSSTSTTPPGPPSTACERGEPGIYNVIDDEPAPSREWLPAYAEALGAKRPCRVPGFIGRAARRHRRGG